MKPEGQRRITLVVVNGFMDSTDGKPHRSDVKFYTSTTAAGALIYISSCSVIPACNHIPLAPINPSF